MSRHYTVTEWALGLATAVIVMAVALLMLISLRPFVPIGEVSRAMGLIGLSVWVWRRLWLQRKARQAGDYNGV